MFRERALGEQPINLKDSIVTIYGVAIYQLCQKLNNYIFTPSSFSDGVMLIFSFKAADTEPNYREWKIIGV